MCVVWPVRTREAHLDVDGVDGGGQEADLDASGPGFGPRNVGHQPQHRAVTVPLVHHGSVVGGAEGEVGEAWEAWVGRKGSLARPGEVARKHLRKEGLYALR